MNKNKILIALALVIALQLMVLAGEYLNAVYPLWTGKEIKLRTLPVDPRSLFRGNYALLRYEISNIKAFDFKLSRRPRQGEMVYVKLKPDKNGIYVYDGVSLSNPRESISIRGRIQQHRFGSSGSYRVKYGIEAYFAPKKKALKIEKRMRRGGIAVIMLAKNGKATLKDVLDPSAKID